MLLLQHETAYNSILDDSNNVFGKKYTVLWKGCKSFTWMKGIT